MAAAADVDQLPFRQRGKRKLALLSNALACDGCVGILSQTYRKMAYIITEPCIDVKDGDCTVVCPVDCIYEGGRMFYIHPDECINCGLCLSICPVDAIVWDGELPASMKLFEAVNSDFFGDAVTGWGSPGGWDAAHTTHLDHPAVAAWRSRQAIAAS